MSVQLILYPQSYNGTYNVISTSATQFIVNGINFTNLVGSPTYTSSVVPTLMTYADTLSNAPALIPNAWYRFRNNNGGSPAFPTVVAGNLVLDSIATPQSISGVYQKLTNLVIGQQYTITINLSAITTGFIFTKIADGSGIYAQSSTSAAVTTITETFTAQASDVTVMIAYVNTIVGTATITDLSVQPISSSSLNAVSGATNVLDNGQVICDLYEDEDIPLTLSVDEFKNVAEKVQSYSKAFNLPGTKRNNRIFDQMFEVTRSDDGIIFNAYKKTQCVLKQNGFILFEGYLRLLDVTDKEGEISYNVNLYSEVIALADSLKDLDFRALDFTELEHDYNKIQITASWNDFPSSGITYTNPSTSGFRDANDTVKYPFVDWNHQIILGGSGHPSATTGNPELPNLETAFRPFINVKYLIDRIFEATPFTYESTFFATADFKKLYMDFNWGSERNGASPLTEGALYQEFDEVSDYWFNSPNWTVFKLNQNVNSGTWGPNLWNNTNYTFTSSVSNLEVNVDYYLRVINTDVFGSRSNGLRICKFNILGNVIETLAIDTSSIAAGGSKVLSGTFSTVLQIGEYIQAQGNSQSTNKVRIQLSAPNCFMDFNFYNTESQVDTLLYATRGELGQWDFLKGLITMFNLVTMPDEDNPNNIKIEPYSDVFINSTDSVQLDWTEKIDVSEMKLTPLADLNRKTIFKFVEDDDDYMFNRYKFLFSGKLYGSKKFPETPMNEFNILDGKDEIIAEPFAATVIKPLMSQFPQFITPSIYAMGDDGVSEGFENSPRIMYNNGIKTTGVSYYIPAQNGGTSTNETNFLQFSHIKDGGLVISDYADFHFGECQLLTNQASTLNNLFNLYWLPYYSELYNPNTRIMTIKVNLNPADINTFKFNDTVFIKNRVFRVNKIDYKPNDLATVEFILIP